MIGWYVPLSMYPAGYGESPKVPLSFVALASQKSGMVLHFMCFYGHFRASPSTFNSSTPNSLLQLLAFRCPRFSFQFSNLNSSTF